MKSHRHQNIYIVHLQVSHSKAFCNFSGGVVIVGGWGFATTLARLFVIFQMACSSYQGGGSPPPYHGFPYLGRLAIFIQREEKPVGSQKTSSSYCLSFYQPPYQNFDITSSSMRQIVRVARVLTSFLITVFETTLLILGLAFEVTLITTLSLRDDF